MKRKYVIHNLLSQFADKYNSNRYSISHI